MLNALNYLKTLDGFSKNHPIISLNSDGIIENYHDYFIINGLLYVVGVTPTLVGKAFFSVTLVNPAFINAVYVPPALNADISNISNSVSVGNWKSTAKDIISGLKSGKNNFGIPYDRVFVNLNSQEFTINSSVVVGPEMFSEDETVLDINHTIGNPYEGNTMPYKMRIFGTYDNITSMTCPLEHIDITPFIDYANKDIKNFVYHYKKNHQLLNGIPYQFKSEKDTTFYKGSRIYYGYKEAGSDKIKYKYFISKVDDNYRSPVEKGYEQYWLEYTPKSSGDTAIYEEQE